MTAGGGPAAPPRRVCARAGRAGTGRGGRGRGGVSGARTPAQAPPASPSLPSPLLRLPVRRALLTGRASQPTERPRCAPGQGEWSAPPSAPRTGKPPIGAQASRRVRAPGSAGCAPLGTPGHTPGRLAAPLPESLRTGGVHLSFVPAPRCGADGLCPLLAFRLPLHTPTFLLFH